MGIAAPAASSVHLPPGLSQIETVPLAGVTTTSFLNSGAGAATGAGDGVGAVVAIGVGVGVGPPVTVKPRVAGVRSGLPAASTARTWNVCGPPARFSGVAYGDEQGANGASSTRHSKREPGSAAENVNVVVVGEDVPESIAVSGAEGSPCV